MVKLGVLLCLVLGLLFGSVFLRKNRWSAGMRFPLGAAMAWLALFLLIVASLILVFEASWNPHPELQILGVLPWALLMLPALPLYLLAPPEAGSWSLPAGIALSASVWLWLGRALFRWLRTRRRAT